LWEELLGEKLLSVTIMTLFMFLGIDWFVRWYKKFLSRSVLNDQFRKIIIRLVWIISATIFWFTLYRGALPQSFTKTHFAFALFVFSIFGLLRNLITKEK
jgi:hypothetical protein